MNSLVRHLFDLLPDLAGYFVAMVGVGLLFVAELMQWLEKHRRTRFAIAGVITLLGLGAVISNSVQRDEDKAMARAERDVAQVARAGDQVERIKLQNQMEKLIAAQLASSQDAKNAREETISVRAALARSEAALSKQIAKTEGTLATNINKYRSDTSSAVSRMLKPPRTLGEKRPELVRQLKIIGPHTLFLMTTRGNRDALDFSNEIEAAFVEAGWKIEKPLKFITTEGIGLNLHVRNIADSEIKPLQLAVAKAFKAIGMQLNGWADPQMTDEDIVELYVGIP